MKTVIDRAINLNRAAWRDSDNKNYHAVLKKAKRSIELLGPLHTDMYEEIYLVVNNHRLIARVFSMLGKHQDALDASRAAIAAMATYVKKFPDSAHRLLVTCYGDMASIFNKSGDDTEVHKYALLSLRQSLNIKNREDEDIEREIDALEKIGDVYIRREKYIDALDCFDAVLDKCEDEVDSRLAKCQYNMAKTFALLNNTDAAKFYYAKAIAVMNDIFSPTSRDKDNLEKYRNEEQLFLSGIDAEKKRKAEEITNCSATIFAVNKRRKVRETTELQESSKNFLAVNGSYEESKIGGHSLRKRGK